MFDTAVIASKLWKQMGCQESHGDMEPSWKEQCLMETYAASDAAQQHPVSAREICPFRAHTRQVTRSTVWEQTSSRQKKPDRTLVCATILLLHFKKITTLNCCLSPPSFALNDPRDPFSIMFPCAARTVKIHCGECSTYDSFGFVYCCIFPGWCSVTFFPSWCSCFIQILRAFKKGSITF